MCENEADWWVGWYDAADSYPRREAYVCDEHKRQIPLTSETVFMTLNKSFPDMQEIPCAFTQVMTIAHNPLLVYLKAG